MKNTALLLPSAQLKKFETMRENFLRIINQYYGNIIRRQTLYVEKFNGELKRVLGENFSTYVSGNYVYVNYLKGDGVIFKEVASINVAEMSVNFRRKGSPMVTKQIGFSRNFTPERVASYVVRFGIK